MDIPKLPSRFSVGSMGSLSDPGARELLAQMERADKQLQDAYDALHPVQKEYLAALEKLQEEQAKEGNTLEDKLNEYESRAWQVLNRKYERRQKQLMKWLIDQQEK